MQAIKDLIRLYDTVRYLRPVQIYRRLWFRLYRPRPETGPEPDLRNPAGDWTKAVEKPECRFEGRRFRFLNVERECDFPAAWQRLEWGRLWLYNLHYFDCLAAVGEQPQKAGLIARWIADNPPGTGCGWEPYPLSLRIVNWIKWALAGNELPDGALWSLAVQARWLRRRLEFHLLGNHLFANGKALVFAGLFFAGAEAEGWLETGLSILGREIPEQVLADGGHFERSPMYHAIILEDLLDLKNLFRVYGREFPDRWDRACGRMGRWLKTMCHPDGEIALFNDAALGIAARPAALADYARRLGLRPESETDEACGRGLKLPASGYYVMAPEAGSRLFVDCGKIGPDYQPGHAHCDLLSLELSLGGKRVIVDSGCGIYVDGEIRRYNRGNRGHNTVTVDGRNQSEVWGAHRCGRRARPLSAGLGEEDGGLVFRGSHDGYRFLSGRVIHQRKISWRGQIIEVEDRFNGSGRHRLDARLHINPELSLSWQGDAAVIDLGHGRRLVIEPGMGLSLAVSDGFYCPEFGRCLPCQVLTWVQDTELPVCGGWRLTFSD